MPSNVTGLTQYFIEGAAEGFAYRIAPLNAFAKVSVQDGCNLNDVVRVPFVTGSSTRSSTFAHSTGYAVPDSYVEGKAVTMGTWNYRQWDGTDSDLVRLTPDAQRALGHKLGNLLAVDVVSGILANTGSFTNNSVASGSAYAVASQLTALGKLASTNRWPVGDRSLIVTPALYWQMAGNTTTLLANSYGGSNVVQQGILDNYYGFKVYESDCVPSTIQGIACSSQALAVAISVPVPQDGHNLLEVRRLVAPDGTDLPIQYVRYYDNVKRKMTHVFETIWGATALDTTSAYNLKVTDVAV